MPNSWLWVPKHTEAEAQQPPEFFPAAAPPKVEEDLPECRMRVLHINDVYMLDNLPVVKSAVAGESAGFPESNLLTTLSGDFLGPSMLSSLDHGQGMVDVLNKVPIKAVCFGNHECDVPYPSLCKRIQEFQGTWLNSNMPTFEPKLPRHKILELEGGRRVALVGLNIGGGEFASLYRDGSFDGHAEKIVPPMAALNAVVAEVRAAYPRLDAIIPLTHQDMPEDIAMAEKGIFPIIIGGHDHAVFEETHNGTLVIKAGEDARNLAVIDLVWPEGAPRGAPPTVTHKLVPMVHPKPKKGEPACEDPLPYSPDEELTAVVDKWLAPAKELERATLAFIEGEEELSSVGVRCKPSTMARLIATAMRDVVKADACIVNAGGVRGNRIYDDRLVTYAQLSAECPFPSSNVVIKVPGGVFADAVKESRKTWPDEEDAAAFHADEGVEIAEDNVTVTAVAGEPLDPERIYNVLVDAYMVGTNPVLKAYAQEHPDRIPPDDAGSPALPLLVQYFCDKAWRKLADSDGDGGVDEAEVQKLFDMADKNKDGQLDESEVIAALQHVLGPQLASGVVARQMLSIADQNHDGKVSREELSSILLTKVACHTA
mmetsp:Transcript_30957/g.100828  ORF Transcript_30957/g.100828 Transcript_30957/m.100828 type:complete len:598 (+) Transcript_30957:275-2068(+)